MTIFNWFTWNENFKSICWIRGEILAWFTVRNFLHVIIILFLCGRCLICKMKSQAKWNFNWGSAFKIELFVKITISFHKRLHLRCFTGFWMCLCCEYDNYLSVNFPTQPYLLLCLWWFKVLSLSIFPIFYETLTPALQLGTKSHRKDCWHLPICSCITEGCFLHYTKS